MRLFLALATALLVCGISCGTVLAEATQIDVRVISKGAKFMGTSMGGAEVIIRDSDTREILAHGKTWGTTGDTDRIMRADLKHHDPVATPDAGVFHATIDLAEPRKIEVTARGPLAQPQATNTVSATQWVIPGLPVVGGDGFLLELPGFVVDVLDPPAHRTLSKSPELVVSLRANVCLMCGCPVTPGGLWDADTFQVSAIVLRDGEKILQKTLRYAGKTSQFHTSLEVSKTGVYEVTVYAYDPANGNTGLDKTTFIVTE